MGKIIERDKYGKKTRYSVEYEDYFLDTYYTYDSRGNLILQEAYDREGSLTYKKAIQYEYDKEGNITCFKYIFYDGDIKTGESEYYYDNIYSEDNLLLEVICPSISREYHRKKYYYDNRLLVKKEYFQDNDELVYVSLYKYDLNNHLKEKKVILSSGYISHYVSYRYIDNDRYYKTIVAPSGNRNWKIDEVLSNGSMCVTLFEDNCEPTLIEDVVKYVIECIPYDTSFSLYISLNNADNQLFWEENDNIIVAYREKNNIYITLLP